MIAFSPGFYYAPHSTGKPLIFISHGKQDDILPVDACSRRIVSRLEKDRYDFVYHEFEGSHILPESISHQALDWFIGKNG